MCKCVKWLWAQPNGDSSIIHRRRNWNMRVVDSWHWQFMFIHLFNFHKDSMRNVPLDTHFIAEQTKAQRDWIMFAGSRAGEPTLLTTLYCLSAESKQLCCAPGMYYVTGEEVSSHSRRQEESVCLLPGPGRETWPADRAVSWAGVCTWQRWPHHTIWTWEDYSSTYFFQQTFLL